MLFLVNYSFKIGKFENKIVPCDIKKIIDKKLENFKYIFINKKIHINMLLDESDFIVNSIEPFLSSIIGNIVSNMAFHALENQEAIIEIYKKENQVHVDFRNNYSQAKNNFSLGLEFCKKLAHLTKADLKYTKTKDSVCVNLKIPNLRK